MKPLRVLLVEDSLTARRALAEILEEAGHQVVGEAGDSETALALCRALRPDVVTMDMVLDGGDSGAEATEAIMAWCPTPILVVSGSTNRGEAFRTYDALAAGAVDVLEKLDGGQDPAIWGADFLRSVALVARIPVITHPRGRRRVPTAPPEPRPLPPANDRQARVLAIGCSTGGPGALLQVLTGLPPAFAGPVLVVVHIGEAFGQHLCGWLDQHLARGVQMARQGEPLPPAGSGRVLVAPPGRHLLLRDGRLALDGQAALRHGCRPSVDVLFESLAAELGPRVLGCLLSGMGRDGALGLRAIKRAGGATVVQDEATSVVWGMPGAAVELGAADAVLPLPEIARALLGRQWYRPGRRP